MASFIRAARGLLPNATATNRALFGTGSALLFGGFGLSSTAAFCEETAETPESVLTPPEGKQEEAQKAKPALRPTRRRSRVGRLPNPGRFTEVDKECREVLNVDNFGGARFEINYMPIQLQQKQMVFVLNTEVDNAAPLDQRRGMGMGMGGPAKDKNIEFGTTLANNNQLFLARVYNDGRIMGRFHHMFSNKVTFKQIFQSKEAMSLITEVDIEGRDYFLLLKGSHSPDGVQLGTSYMQSITPTLSLGSELNHQVDAGTHLTMVGRYANSWNKDSSGDYASAQISTMGYLVGNYTFKVNPYYSLASELQISPNQFTGVLEPQCTVGAVWKYQTFNLQAKMTSTAELSAALEHRMQPGLTFLLSGAVAQFKNNSAFGIGFRFGN